MKTKEWMTVCVSVLTLFLARPASADVMTYTGLGLYDTVQMHAPGHVADGQTVYAGQYMFSYQGATYAAWCVDIDQYSGTTQVTQESYTVLRNSSAAAYLYETYADSVSTGTEAAALAASIWEVITEPQGGPFNIYSGGFYISNNSAAAGRAAAMLASIPAGYTPQGTLVVLHSADKQDMLIGYEYGGPVPEPATIVLLLGGLVLSAARHRRRRL
jgi:hypothetical protein